MTEDRLKGIVAKNITEHRKNLGLTQLELAEKLNYTDKSVSKWERAETLPDAFILKQLADLFNVTVNDLITECPIKIKAQRGYLRNKKIAVPVLSVLLNFFVATVIFCSLFIFKAQVPDIWLTYIFALVSASIILIVFSAIWWNKTMTAVFTSTLTWSAALSLFLATHILSNFSWLLFVIAAVFQILIVIWFVFKKTKRHTGCAITK